MKTNDLFGAFPPVGDKQWKQQMQADLKGGDYNQLLTWTSPEGIQVKPFYTESDWKSADGIPPKGQSTWSLGFGMDPSGGEDPQARARQALEGGVDALILEKAEKAPSLEWLNALPGDPLVYMEWHDLSADLPEPKTKGIQILADPIGHLAATGNWAKGMEADLKRLSELNSPAYTLGVRAYTYQEAGANRVQELAYSLAHAHEYLLRASESKALQSLVENPVFCVAVGGDYFMEIAKLRALRKGWALLAQAHGLSGHCRILARPSWRNKTLYDYNTNMLRTTAECMAAILGGADVVYNLPYDGLYHLPNGFADRIGRNQLLLLRHEGYFSAVENPADGAYYIEALTDQLGQKSLELLKTLENGGGLLVQLKNHQIQKKIRESAQKAQAEYEAGQQVLVGSNVFPNPEDRMAAQLERPVFGRNPKRKTLIEPLPLRRLSAREEQKRLQDESR